MSLDGWDEDELLFVTGNDIHYFSYFFFNAFLLALGGIVVFGFW